MLNLSEIGDFLNQTNYDLRVSGNARWIDQKCTPDILWSISDFILNYVNTFRNTFTVADIWNSDYAKETIVETYSKPGIDEQSAENEYDKVFSQPINLLCYAGVLEDISPTNRHLYRIKNNDVLEYISLNDNNSMRFLQLYIEKVLKDSDMYSWFESFFISQTPTSFQNLKDTFIKFYHDYTPVQKDYEPKRIFTKVLNPLAYKNRKRGTERGRLSSNAITRSDLMYNRDNFRDVYLGKPKEVSRQEWLHNNPQIDIRRGYFKQMLRRAKKNIRDNISLRDNISELTQFGVGHDDIAPATQIHHMFPKNEFPEIEHIIENLIALTPNQHYGFAHPNNNTQIVDLAAQEQLLLAKMNSIKYNIENEQIKIYDFNEFLHVLEIGFDDQNAKDIQDGDYIDLLHFIIYHYNFATA
ncbi:hypothetical protein [Metamycoplasma hominis]|jgi:hypothetical protein|uniref:hypothetical protein n=1 Tax=Metamycoplasma hominis TaxID=2098 RepID=UPI0006990490|nr:hypothetical protein [Metamycoplasma hominis]MDU7418443.1 hypothetical protein [Metamycoplasma hominis]